MCLVFGVATSCALLLPWFDVGGPPRSTVELIATAGALDVIAGPTRVAIVVAWALVPVSSAIAVFATAARRRRVATIMVAGASSLIVAVGGWLILTRPRLLAWGAWVGLACATSALLAGVIWLRHDRRPASSPGPTTRFPRPTGPRH